MSGRRRYATQADIAALAGVSRATVSLAIKGSPHVSSEKRERVLAAAESLGYVNNAIASALAGNRSRLLIGLLVQSLLLIPLPRAHDLGIVGVILYPFPVTDRGLQVPAHGAGKGPRGRQKALLEPDSVIARAKMFMIY